MPWADCAYPPIVLDVTSKHVIATSVLSRSPIEIGLLTLHSRYPCIDTPLHPVPACRSAPIHLADHRHTLVRNRLLPFRQRIAAFARTLAPANRHAPLLLDAEHEYA